MRYGESAPEIIRRVKAKLAEVSKGLPPGVSIVPFYDRSDLIARAVGTLQRALLEEILLVTLAHVVFLMHFRSILIVTLPLPLAILSSFILMRVFGITSNIMSLGGIAIAIGVLVDAGIVITENVFRHYETDAGRKPIAEIVRDASRQIGRPIFFSMVIILLAFLPVFSLAGEEGKLFHPLAFTKTFAMIGATVLSVTLVPVLATFLIRGRVHREEDNPVMRLARRIYEPVLAAALRHKARDHRARAGRPSSSAWSWWLAGAVLLAPAAAPLGVAASLSTERGPPRAGRPGRRGAGLARRATVAPGIGREFMPPLDEGTLMFMPVTSNSVSLTQAIEIMKKQDAILRSFPEVASVVGKVGRAESAARPGADQHVRDARRAEGPGPVAPRHDEGEAARGDDAGLAAAGSHHDLAAADPQPDRHAGDRHPDPGRGQGVRAGPRRPREEGQRDRRGRPGACSGSADVYAEQILGTPYLEIRVDREAAARYGVRVGDVLEVIETAIGGENLTTTIEGRNRFPVRVRYSRELRDDVEKLGRILVPAMGSAPMEAARMMPQVPLGEVADIRIRPGPSMVSAENGLLRERVFLNVRGRDVGSFVDEAKRTVEAKVTLPPGYFVEWAGQYEHQLRARNRLALVVPLCFAIIFLLLYVTYRSAREAAHVILAIPFALTGGNLLLWVLHRSRWRTAGRRSST